MSFALMYIHNISCAISPWGVCFPSRPSGSFAYLFVGEVAQSYLLHEKCTRGFGKLP